MYAIGIGLIMNVSNLPLTMNSSLNGYKFWTLIMGSLTHALANPFTASQNIKELNILSSVLTQILNRVRLWQMAADHSSIFFFNNSIHGKTHVYCWRKHFIPLQQPCARGGWLLCISSPQIMQPLMTWTDSLGERHLFFPPKNKKCEKAEIYLLK